MLRASSWGLLISMVLCQVGCSSDSSSSSARYVADTLGNVYSVSCSSFCTLTPKDTSHKPLSCASADGVDTFVLTGSRILTVHALMVLTYGGASFSDAEPARPVFCASDADCLPGLGYACQNELCQKVSTTTPMTTTDVIALCQADIPWPLSCPYVTNPLFAERLTKVAEVCGSTTNCSTVPAECRQPEPIAPGLDAGAPVAPGLDGGAVDSGT
jgi:hypothetical protein